MQLNTGVKKYKHTQKKEKGKREGVNESKKMKKENNKNFLTMIFSPIGSLMPRLFFLS